jgi:hypothetical protein
MHVETDDASDASIHSELLEEFESLTIEYDDSLDNDSIELMRHQANAETGNPEYPEDMLLIGQEINLNGESFVSHAFASEEIFTHHLDGLSLLETQEIASNDLCDEFKDVFVCYNDEQYSLGVAEDNKIVQSFDAKLQLCATSFAIVQTMQKTRVDCMLKVLFDSGSDKTMLKRSSLPKGISPSIGRKRKVTGVTASVSTDTEVLLENLSFPEFSPTQ